MTEYDYSGIDTERGRWWGLIGGSLMVLAAGAIVAVLVIVVYFLIELTSLAD